MLEKMSSTQRLVLAIALSFVFFIGYTTIFPPEQPAEQTAQAKTETVALKESPATTADNTADTSADAGHEIRSDETVAKGASSTLVTIDTDAFTMKIDTLGRIASKVLKDAKFNKEENSQAELISDIGAKPLYIRFADADLNKAAAAVPYKTDVATATLAEGEKVAVTLTQELPGVTVTKKVTFYTDGHYDATIDLSEEKRHFVYLGQRPRVSDQMMTVLGAMVYDSEEINHVFEDGDVEGRETFTGVKLTSSFDQYFATMFYGLDAAISVMVERDRDDNPVVYFDAPQHVAFNGYIGPKDHAVLNSIDPILVNAIEYGWFTFAAAPLFKLLMWLHGIFGNWGWAIVALTVIIRIFLFPLTHKGMLGMQKMKEIAPKVKELQAKYKGDPQRMNAAVMELYKKHGANPLGGCLPLLLQIPVFFAIYRVLLNAVELQGAEWILWINDLSRMDPYMILPLLMGASMFYQQKMTPSNFTDPMQEKIFKFLPIIFTFFFITFPAGLVLYWLTNNLASIAQQYVVNKQFEAAKAARHEEHLAEKSHGKD
jgi:YidC/Oxa1 family membrane protein insertase